jgi:hypothetical protein
VRTSGKATDAIIVIPGLVLAGFLVWLAGGPSAAVRLVDGFLRELTDFVGSFF